MITINAARPAFVAGQTITLRDYSKPIKTRHGGPCGPYTLRVPEVARGPVASLSKYGFYMRYSTSRYLETDPHGSPFALRIEWANDLLRGRRLSDTLGYYVDDCGDDAMQPIVARLSHGRGFLAGWTLGAGMASLLHSHIWTDAADAAVAAHDMAARDAEVEREFQAELNDNMAVDDNGEDI